MIGYRATQFYLRLPGVARSSFGLWNDATMADQSGLTKLTPGGTQSAMTRFPPRIHHRNTYCSGKNYLPNEAVGDNHAKAAEVNTRLRRTYGHVYTSHVERH